MNHMLVELIENSVTKKIIALLLIVALTMVDFILFGIETVSYAADILETGTATNNKNVTFDCYFKDTEGKILNEKEENIDSNNMKLFLQVSVKNDGYFIGNITIGDANFKLKNEILSNSINKIEGNTIYLNQINSGEAVEMEIGIEPIKDDTINSGFLNMLSKVSINGIYRNSKEKDINILATRDVQLILTNPYVENDGAELKSKIITNKVYEINGENKRVVQVLVESGLKGNSYPVKEDNIELSVPDGVEKVEVISRETLSTNGKTENEFNTDNWTYLEESQKVIISIENEEENGTIKWIKTGKDNLVVTYVMDASLDIQETEITVKNKITMFDTKTSTMEATNTVEISEEVDGIITSGIKTTEPKIYKGKLYSSENRDYKDKTNIYINKSDVERAAKIELLPTTYKTAEGEVTSNIQYTNTVVNKEEVLRVLGEEGTLKILTIEGNLIAEVNKDAQTDENGNVVVNYPDGTLSAKVETTTVEKTGTISLNNTKTIKQDEYDRNIKSTFNAIIEKITGAEAEITLEESSAVAKLQLNKTSLSTLTENTGVEITATLKTNSEENDLFKNPNIKIKLPSQVQEATINSVNLLYEDELQASPYNVHEEDGVKVIEVALVGEQTKHNDGNVEGATLIINTDLSLNKKATNSDERIIMTCTNQNTGSVVETGQPIEIVSPRGMVTINSIQDYNMSVIGEEETKTSNLALGAEAKEAEVNIEVINNNEETIKDVKIVGDFPTKNNTNTIETTVGTVNIENTNATVYYTENENATESIEDSANGWSTEITNNASVKKYLIAVDSMEQSQDLSASYKLTIPEGLQYNEQAYEGYKVIYSNANTTSQVMATTLGLTTGKGPEIKASIKAKSGNTELKNNDEVTQGEFLKYEITVENTGTETATNVSVLGIVPNGTIYVEPKEDFIYQDGYYNELPDKREATFDIEKIEPGEKITKTYEVKVTKNASINGKLENKATAKYGEATSESETISTIVKEGNLNITIKRASDLEAENYRGEFISYFVIVENISDKEQKDVNVAINLPKELTITYMSKNDGEEEEKIDISNPIKIGDMKAGEKKVIFVTTEINELEHEDEKSVSISATAKSNNSSEVKSNEYEEILKDFKLNISLSANNENGYVKTDDIIEYMIKVENTSNVDATGISIDDLIPEQLTVQSLYINGEEIAIENDEDEGENEGENEDESDNINVNDIMLSSIVKANSTVEAKVRAIVNYDEGRTEPVMISNVATISEGDDTIATSQEVSHIIQADSAVAENGGDVSNKNLISGVAWIDENQNGQRESEEKLLNGTNVKLIDLSGNIVKDETGKELVATTNNKGFYMISNIPQGQYLTAFEYDSSKYALTAYQKSGVPENKNSDAILKQIAINGVEGTYGVTDTITINETGISNIDMGLITSTKFDLELNKYISKLVIQTSKETKTYNYDKASLAKAEIAAKQLQGANVIIEYQIEVKNTGDVAGYVKNIVDYMPSSLKFSSELNKDWYQSGTNLYNKSLSNTKLEAGETKTISLTLTKAMTEENTGLVNNKAEIAESYNEAGIKDVDSTAGNKAQGEDDMGSADVIIGVKTGAMVTYVSLTIAIIALIGVAAYFVNKKINKDTDIEVNF